MVVGLVDYQYGRLNACDVGATDMVDVVAESMICKGLIYRDLVVPWNSWKASRHD